MGSVQGLLRAGGLKGIILYYLLFILEAAATTHHNHQTPHRSLLAVPTKQHTDTQGY